MYEDDFENGELIMSKYELVVRKKISQFIEKEFRYFGYEFSHDEYKKVSYGEKGFETTIEEKLKAYYDACIFLLSNAKNPLTKKIINRFFYLIFDEPLNEITILSIESYLMNICEASPIEKACEFHMFIYNRFSNLKDLDRQLISLIFFNYILVKNDIPAIKLVGRDITKYVKARDEYKENKEELFLFFSELIKSSFVLEKSYLENLKELSVEDISKTIREMEEELRTKYKVENVFLYGSFAKGIDRMDSDIDLLMRLSLDISYDDRLKIIEELKDVLFLKFNRFTDIEEVREFFSEDFIKEAKKIKKIF